MARKLKTYQTSLGFYDLAIAAPSMKAALEAWGAGSNLFHQGVARETDDPDAVAAAMSKPSVVLKRPAGSNGRFAEHSDLPSDLGTDGNGARREKRRPKSAKRAAPEISERDARKAAADFERSANGGKPSAGAKRPLGKRSANGARRRRQKRKPPWTRPSASMRRGQPPSGPRPTLSRSVRAPRTSGGKRNGSGCRPRYGMPGSKLGGRAQSLRIAL